MKQVIVVGAGNWGKNLIRNFYQLDALAGVAEVNPQLRDAIAEQYPDIPLFTNYEQALASTTPAIVLATPAPTHFKLGWSALAAGKDLFVEKPMTLETSEARQLAEYAEQQFRILMVGHLLLYQPAIHWIRDYIAKGKMGEIHHISTQRANLGKVRTQENAVWSLAAHDISIILDLLGNPEVESVTAQGHDILQPRIEDDAHVHIRFQGNKTAHIHSSWFWPNRQRQTIILGSQQMLVYDEVAQKITIHHKRIDEQLQVSNQGTEVVEIGSPEPLKLECEHFLDCLETRQKPLSDGWNGVAVVDILAKAQKYLSHGRSDES